MKVGDRIGYARPWLQSVTGGDPTSELWHRRGTLVELRSRSGTELARVRWDDDPEHVATVALANVAKLGSYGFAHADAPGWVGYPGLGEKPRSLWKRIKT